MSNDDWQTAIDNAEELIEISKNKSSPAWFKLIDEYYSSEIVIQKNNMLKRIDDLKP